MEITAELLATVSAFFSGILVLYIVKQYKFAQKQYETVNRPWLVLEKSGLIVDNIELTLENIGNLPAEKITVRSKCIFHNNDGQKIPPDSEKQIISIGIIVPKQKYHFTFGFLDIMDVQNCEEMNADIFVNYYFGKKEKTSRFHYAVNNNVDFEEITCEEAT